MSRLGVDLKIIISSIASQEKENKILCQVANEEMGSLYLTLDNSKSDQGQGDYQDQIKNVQGTGEFKLSNVSFVQKGAVRVV